MKYILTLFIISASLYCHAQETIEHSRKLTPQVNEKYHVLKTDYSKLQGQYSAYLKKTLIATGWYTNNKRSGTWTFFTKKGKPTQRFNYDTQSLLYEGPPDSTFKAMYIIDDSLKNNPKFTRPVRIGSTYYGFLNYENLVRLPKDYWSISNEVAAVNMEILISPYGRLAEFKVRIKPLRPQILDEQDAVFNLNIKLLDEDDKIFIPATLNGENVAVRMVIPCRFVGADRIEML